MVYIASWQEYQVAAEALYAKAPDKVRYCVKWKAGTSQLVLKITDDVECIKFKTHSSIFLNRFDALNLSLLTKMTNRRPPPPPAPVPTKQSLAHAPHSASTPPPGETSRSVTPLPSAGGPAGGGVSKKKGKKKK